MADLYANFLELWGLAYMGDVSKYMYKGGIYEIIFLFIFFVPLFVWILYYKVIDNIKLANIKSWSIILLIVFMVCGVFSYFYSYNEVTDYLFKKNIQKYDITYIDVITFSIIAAIWSAAFSFVYSWVFKNLSIKARNIPF